MLPVINFEFQTAAKKEMHSNYKYRHLIKVHVYSGSGQI